MKLNTTETTGQDETTDETSEHQIDPVDLYRVLRETDPGRSYRLVLYRNAGFEEVEIGPHGVPEAQCWFRVLPWGVAGGEGFLPFEPSVEALTSLARANQRLHSFITDGLRSYGCGNLAERIEGRQADPAEGAWQDATQHLFDEWNQLSDRDRYRGEGWRLFKETCHLAEKRRPEFGLGPKFGPAPEGV